MNIKKRIILNALIADVSRKVTAEEFETAVTSGRVVGETGDDASDIYEYNNEYYVEAVFNSRNFEAFKYLNDIKDKYGYVLLPDRDDPGNRSLWYDL